MASDPLRWKGDPVNNLGMASYFATNCPDLIFLT